MAALLLTSSVSCSSSSTQETESTLTPEVTESVVEEETVIPLGIPEEDNGGRTFKVLVPTEKEYEFVTKITGEAVNDAAFERSAEVEEHFNIKFSYQYEKGGWGDKATYNNIISNAVHAGDSSYDYVTGYIVCTFPLATQDTFIDLAQMDDLNLDNPWWMNNQFDDLNTNGQLFCCLGDVNLSIYKDCSVFFSTNRFWKNSHWKTHIH